MATGKHKLLSIGPTEPWSIREKLCLASSVMRSGDQNWVSVSRAIKPFAEPGRPPDWFSQKHCASQYSELLETTETPKRKRGERGEVVETVEDVIVRKLTAERIEELKKMIKETQDKYRKLKKEAELIHIGHMDSKLEELWNDIMAKKKQEEEEAEMKRKATDAAYQVRQAAKNIPRRSSSTVVRSSVGASSPGGEFGLGDLTPNSTEEGNMGVNEGEINLGTNNITGSGVLMDVGVLPSLHGAELHPVAGTIPASPAASVTQQDDNESTSDPHTVTVSMDSSDISMIIDSINKDCLGNGDSSTQSKDESSDSKGDLDLTDKMDIAVSYTGEELDFETVGDIIAIIEDKVDDHPEVLDVAAVEAALSFCEENDDPQALGGPWDQAVQEHTVKQETLPKSLIPVPKDPDTIMNIMELTDIKAEPSEPELEPAQSEGASVTSHSTFQQEIPEEELSETGVKESIKEEEEEEVSDHQVKMEEPQCETSQSGAFSNEEEKGIPSPEDPTKSEPPAANQNKDSQGEEEEEEDDVTSEVGSPEEPKEEEAGEEYLSEMDNEPPISESDDGFSIHNAPLQSHTLADSIPSSPASSQFSVCSEDQEAIQAQKIWKKAIMLVWRAAANHRYANVFLQPVTDDIAPGYHSIVQRPMDLSTIKKNIETGLIRSTAEFQRDIMLMFQNAVMYNSSDHDVYHMAVEMQRDVLEQIQQFLATQLIMQTSESGISAKSLRGRDSTRKQDASEKDSVPMGSPAFLLSLFVEDHRLSQSTTSVYDLMSCPEKSCIKDWSEEDRGFLGMDLENNDQSHLELEKTEHKTTDTIPPSEALVVNESFVGSTQVEDSRLSQFTTSVDDLLSSPENSCIKDWSESDGGFLGRNLENNVEGQSHLELEKTEHKTTDTIQSSDVELVVNESAVGCTQVGDSRLSQSTTSIDDLLSFPQNSCIKDWSEGDGGFLGKNVENNVEGQSHLELEKTEHKTTDTNQSSDLALVINISAVGCTQDLNVEETVRECIDSQLSQLWEPVSEVDPTSMNQYENGISICESTECIIPKTISLFELLVLNTRKFNQEHNIRKKLSPIWKMLADHRYAGPFLKPLKEKEAPGYKDIVKRPMDLATMKRGLSKGSIRTSAEFQRDILLMLQNAVMYNSVQHIVHQRALEIQRDVKELLQVQKCFKSEKLKTSKRKTAEMGHGREKSIIDV
ncbi:bromodomain-containing protein 8 isoform X4 [Rhinoderma darwinii]|uniref:bromodomain-containing protein 8 isoform X4 n=1 Tax=Rhinoderma darwinii TaxID=43563 RepID=UPI003F6636DC